MSNNAIRFAHRAPTFGGHNAFTSAERADLVCEAPDPLAPTLALSRPDLAGRKPVAYTGGRFIYDEVNVICKVKVGPKKVRYERWIIGAVDADVVAAAGLVH